MIKQPLSIAIIASAFFLAACGKQDPASSSVSGTAPVSSPQTASSSVAATTTPSASASGQFETREQLGAFLSNTIWASEREILHFSQYDPEIRTRISLDVHYIGEWSAQSSSIGTSVGVLSDGMVGFVAGETPVRNGQIEGYTRITEERMRELLAAR